MSGIPFIEARFFNLNDTRSALETRFETYLRRLRGRRSGLLPEDLGNECDALPDPFEVAVARDGIEEARKKFMPVGEGLRLSRPLERVEIDENTIDIISLTESWGLRELLTEEEQKILGLDRGKARWFVTVAICATTRCILGMAFSRSAKDNASLQVLQMILRDKGKWADAAGSLGPWDMHGTPALIVTDNGAAFKSERFRVACADLGITTLRAPAGLAQMRARNERFFHSLNTGLLSRMPGRTFGSIREKGNADPEARAALTFDDLAFCLVRWIVDIYHNTSHAGLGGETPLNCWRRLTAEWGVQPPPDMDTHRAIFGERLPRKLSREGVTVLGLRYHSEALARPMTTALEFGPHVAFDDLSAQDQDAASACGWSYIVDGEASIRHALQILQAGFDPKHSSCRIKKWEAFGPFLDELRHPLPSNPLRRIFEEHLASIVGT